MILKLNIIFWFCLANLNFHANGHGMMLDPVMRTSRWRFNKTAPINYNDNGVWCGGYQVRLCNLHFFIEIRTHRRKEDFYLQCDPFRNKSTQEQTSHEPP